MKRLVILSLVLLLCACAAGGPNPALWNQPPSTALRAQAMRLAEHAEITTSLDTTPRVMRHRVRLRIPGKNIDLAFDGIMRLSHSPRTARVVGMGGFGLKLFDLTVSPTYVTTHFLHPSIARIPHAADRIAFCIRRIWMGYGPTPHDGITLSGKDARLYGVHDGVRLEHGFSKNTLISTTARGPAEFWKILFTERGKTTRLPGKIEFFNENEGYSLVIRRIDPPETGQNT